METWRGFDGDEREYSRAFRCRAWNNERRVMVMDIQELYDQLGSWHNTKGERVDIYKTGVDLSSFGSVLHHMEHLNIVVMRSPGIVDVEGRQIFESDIVERGGASNLIVKFMNDRAEWYLPHHRKLGIASCFDAVYMDELRAWQDRDCRVLGNIYENPELIA